MLAMPRRGSSEALWAQLLGAALKQHAARSAGTLLVWLQQQPQQLHITKLQQSALVLNTPESVWSACITLLSEVSRALSYMTSSTAAPLAAAMTQQLEQSGGCAEPTCADLHCHMLCRIQASAMVRLSNALSSGPGNPPYVEYCTTNMCCLLLLHLLPAGLLSALPNTLQPLLQSMLQQQHQQLQQQNAAAVSLLPVCDVVGHVRALLGMWAQHVQDVPAHHHHVTN
jgi:hypothetical protein